MNIKVSKNESYQEKRKHLLDRVRKHTEHQRIYIKHDDMNKIVRRSYSNNSIKAI